MWRMWRKTRWRHVMPCDAWDAMWCHVMQCDAIQGDAMWCHVTLAMHCKVKACAEYHTRQGDAIVSYVTQCDAMWPNMKQCDANHARQGDSMWCNKTLYEALDALSHCVIHWNTVWRKKLNAMWCRRQNVTLIILRDKRRQTIIILQFWSCNKKERSLSLVSGHLPARRHCCHGFDTALKPCRVGLIIARWVFFKSNTNCYVEFYFNVFVLGGL